MNNLGITISFIIGGLLLVSIITMNANVSQNAGETVLDMSAKETISTINQIMSRDFVRIGYNLPDNQDNAIITANGNKFTFRADIDNDANSKAQEITWEFTDDSNDHKLIRTGPNGKQSVFLNTYKSNNPGNTGFRYIDKSGGIASTKKDIRTIEVNLQTQSAEKYEDGQYAKSIWERKFTPPNLKLQDIKWKN